MKRIVLINGAIAGIIVSALMLISQPLIETGTLTYDNGMIVGYASMVLAFLMIFAGIKSYRDQVRKGFVSFGQAYKVGFMIALVASLIYAVTWDIYYRTAGSDFAKRYTAHYLEKMQAEGANAEEISSMRIQMEDFNTMYQNTFIRFGITLMEILPAGIVITLLSAAILRDRRSVDASV